MTTAIAIKDLTKTYANGFEALKGISLEVEQGDFFALLGPNGAGKSTTIGVLSTLVKKSGGIVEIFGKNVDSHVYETKLDLGVVPQEINFSQFERVKDIVMTQAGYYGMPRSLAAERCEKYLRKLDLWDKRNDRSRTLSGGMKRRLMIARAMMTEPKLLILDEPTAGVDIEIRRGMWKTLKEVNAAGTTVILTTHYLEEAESLCRNLAIIDKGAIIEQGPMKTLLAKLDVEGFVLDINGELPATLPQIPKVDLQSPDSHTLVVEKPRDLPLNVLFDALAESGITVRSMRNQTNRLEELFVRLTAKEQAA